MTLVTVFRNVAPPVIGVCGAVPDRESEAFEQTLDWLETTGVLVERFAPREEPVEAARYDGVRQLLATEGDRCLPLIVVDGVVVSARVRPRRAQLARLVGRSRRDVPSPVAS